MQRDANICTNLGFTSYQFMLQAPKMTYPSNSYGYDIYLSNQLFTLIALSNTPLIKQIFPILPHIATFIGQGASSFNSTGTNFQLFCAMLSLCIQVYCSAWLDRNTVYRLQYMVELLQSLNKNCLSTSNNSFKLLFRK